MRRISQPVVAQENGSGVMPLAGASTTKPSVPRMASTSTLHAHRPMPLSEPLKKRVDFAVDEVTVSVHEETVKSGFIDGDI